MHLTIWSNSSALYFYISINHNTCARCRNLQFFAAYYAGYLDWSRTWPSWFFPMFFLQGIRDNFRFGTYMVYFPVVCAQFILSCFAEYFPEREHGELVRQLLCSLWGNHFTLPCWICYGAVFRCFPQLPCPEQFASFPNRLTFWWFTSWVSAIMWPYGMVQFLMFFSC